jgi:two-component system, NarL family, nitrate/nitrite response regulator NarL
VKKKVQVFRGVDFHGSRRRRSLRTQEHEEGAGKADRSSARRRSATAAAERVPSLTAPIGTVLVGPNGLLREGLARILSAADFSIIASTFCVDDLVLSAPAREQSILLVIDVSDDFVMGLGQIEWFKRQHPGGRVVVLADQHELTEIVSAFRVGANAYLAKVATCETFIKSLELVMLGVTFLPAEILTLISASHACNRDGRAADEAHADDDVKGGEDVEIVGADVGTKKLLAPAESADASRLSARQQTILRWLVQGDSNKTIARKMVMAEATVKVHVKAILRKIRVHNRTQAAIWAMSNGSFIPAKDESPALEAPAEPLPNLEIAQLPMAGHTNGVTSLSTLELKGPGAVAMLGGLRLIRRDD